ncbi:MAG: ROK family protein [Candidatus Sumerlaeota bacterium]|nr:ROK family protein [Candidatus Sumerlaeota bacterium]
MAAKKSCTVGVDLGGTKIRCVAFDSDFKTLGVAKAKMKAIGNAEEGIREMRSCIEDALTQAQLKREDLSGIGFGLPGVLDLAKGRIIRLLNVGWKDVPVRKIFQEEYKTPIAVENDVNAGTYGEFRAGAGKGHEDIVGIFPGTGIGGGIIIGGRLHHGVTGGAGELGHLVYDARGPFCGCGNRGCYEAYASRVAIAGRAAEAVFRGKAPALQEIAGTCLEDIKSGALAKAIKQGDTVIEIIVREAAYMVGQLAACMVNTLSPGLIILGGGLVEAMEEIYLEECRRALDHHAVPELRAPVEVRAAKLGDDAVALGAAALAAEMVADK